MSATAVLKKAQAAGIRVALDGRDLVLEAAAPPPEAILVAFRQHKAEIVRLLSGEEGWTAEDWRAYFDERSAIREHDSGLSRSEAELLAFEDTVDQWLCLNPAAPRHAEAGCAHCGGHDRPGNVLLPILAGQAHTWVHDRCHPDWMRMRRLQAARALAQAGLSSVLPDAGSHGPFQGTPVPRGTPERGLSLAPARAS